MSTHTIGEVLNRLKGEFDDITISKIRFLEAEGLIHPDRTESGYRKFTEADIDRLRYVLRAQRDRYLPLKVIKEELSRLDSGQPVAAESNGDDPQADPSTGSDTATTAGHVDVAAAARLLDAEPTDVQLSGDELADASGLTAADLDGLRDHGLLGPGPRYDAEDLRVVRLAAELLSSGLENRHLRMYRQFADREASLAEQLVSPLLRQRNPESRRTATEQAERLAAVGGELRRMLLAKQLRTLLRS